MIGRPSYDAYQSVNPQVREEYWRYWCLHWAFRVDLYQMIAVGGVVVGIVGVLVGICIADGGAS